MLEKTAEYFNFSWEDLINDPLNTTITNNSQYNDFFNYSTEPTGSNFTYIEEEPSFNPNPAPDLAPPQCLIDAFPDPYNGNRLFWPYIVLLFQSIFWSVCQWHCRGLILYDFNDNTHNIPDYHLFMRPFIFVNNATGLDLENHINVPNYVTHFWINQTWENNVSSFNVIGQINGTNPDKTVILDCLYDGVRNQAAADSAIGIGIMLAIAKEMQYLNDTYHIKPKYTVKFIAFGGEEYGTLGALSYDWRHANENITTLIDLNQLGFSQTGPSKLSLDITTNNLTANTTLKAITNDTIYIQRMNGTTNFSIMYKPGGDDSDDAAFAQAVLQGRRNCTTIGFLKDTTWTLHHRDGNNHTEGDVMKYFNSTDASAIVSMIWNVTKYYTLNPNCSLSNVNFTTFDSPNDGDTLNDSIRTNFTIHSILPNDKVRVEMSLFSEVDGMGLNNPDAWDADYIINNGSQNVSFIFTIPDGVTEGNFSVDFKVYNSTGRINEIIYGALGNYYNDTTESSNWSHLYHPLGYTKTGHAPQTLQNRISGSVFTANENGRADNITAFINQCFNHPGPYKCMLYQADNSALIGTTTQDWVSLPQQGNNSLSSYWAVFNFTGTKPLLVKGTQYVITCWSLNASSSIAYDSSGDSTTGRYENLTYGTPPDPANLNQEPRYYSIYCSYTPDVTPPRIINVSHSPDTVGFGSTIAIHTNVTDNKSGVNTVKVNITNPDQTHKNYTMSLISGSHYRYVSDNTWTTGQYNYTIFATDKSTNMNSSSGHHFHVSADAKISIATLKDSYTGNQYINITDPPNPPENYSLIGRGLTWNTYYDSSSGNNILEAYQGPVNYQDDNSSWTPINNSFYPLPSNHPAYNYGYRTGNSRGLFNAYFKPDISSTWPVAFEYNRSSNPTTDVIRTKLVGVGYLDPQSNWAYHYLQSVQSSQGQTNGNTVTYPSVFTGTDVTWCYDNTELKEAITMSNTTKTLLQNYPPSQYGLNDASSYLVFITKLDYQNLNMYNMSGMLTGNITISDTGVDFKDALGMFKCGMPLGEAYELHNETARQGLTYRIIHYNGDTYLLSGLRLSDLNAMTFPVVIDPTLTVYSTSSDGYIYKSNGNYDTARTSSTGTVSGSASYISIGQKKDPTGPPTAAYTVFRGFLFFNTTSLPSNAYLDNATLSLYKKDDYSTTDFDITVQNGQPTYPHDPLQTSDYNMNDYSGNGGMLTTGGLHNGYNNMSLTDLNWITKNGTTKLCLRSNRDINGNMPTGNEYVNMYANEQGSGYQPKLVINYRNQSKIKNTGSTTIKGYLLIQVQYYSTSQGQWLVDKNTIDETSPRTINNGDQLALDKIFNNHVRASDLTHGTGTYRVYAAFRDPLGNILKTNDGVELKAWWQFSKT